MRVDSYLTLEGISKAFFGVYAVRDVSLNIQKGEVLSLIGENGAGKSTLMNIIGGVYQPDAGAMTLHGKPYVPLKPSDAGDAGIAFIHQELNLFSNLSIMDNFLFSRSASDKNSWFYNRKEQRHLTIEALKAIDLDLSPDTLVERLSPGEKQLVEIAKELSRDPELIIFDEPTTSLTSRETERLFELIDKLRAQGKAIIYISHILNDVMALSDTIVVLRDGQISDKGRIEDFSIDRMIVSMVGRDIKQMYPEKPPEPRKEELLRLDSVSKIGIAKDISFTLHQGEILGIFGLMGSGRSELAHIIFGLEPFDSGHIYYKQKELNKPNPIDRIQDGVAFVTENRREEGLLMEFPVYDNVGIAALRFFTNKAGFVERKIGPVIHEKVQEMRVRSGDIKKHLVKGLSGGNQQKVVIAKWLMTKQSLLIIDEPTRGIDVGAKSEIYKLLNQLASEGTGILVISSELEELTGICNRILVMNKGEIVGQFHHDHFDHEQIIRSAFRQDIGEASHEKA